MRELELKFRVLDKYKLLELLKAKGVQLGRPSNQVDIIFFRAEKCFQDLSNGEPVIRIRQEGEKITTALKKYVNGTLDRQEIEFEVPDKLLFQKYLELIDMHPLVKVVKTRQSGVFKDVTLCLDDVDDLGCFLEVEIVCNDEYAEDNIAKLYSVAKELGLDCECRISLPYDEMLFLKNKGAVE